MPVTNVTLESTDGADGQVRSTSEPEPVTNVTPEPPAPARYGGPRREYSVLFRIERQSLSLSLRTGRPPRSCSESNAAGALLNGYNISVKPPIACNLQSQSPTHLRDTGGLAGSAQSRTTRRYGRATMYATVSRLLALCASLRLSQQCVLGAAFRSRRGVPQSPVEGRLGWPGGWRAARLAAVALRAG